MPDNAHGQWLEQQCFICLAATAVTAFYLHCLSIIMAGIPPPINSSQPWADHDIEVILLHFIAKKSEIGDAGNFKKKTYVAVAEAIRGPEGKGEEATPIGAEKRYATSLSFVTTRGSEVPE
ncbi:hypothetical protein L208DRAFT_1382493 [Tricholoma matsutake]|nr:hypothetical protein L208DRAFT_1382493 [Tricholoma matsutake 945]